MSEPMTLDTVNSVVTIANGVSFVNLLVSGPDDYDATEGALFDLSALFSAVWGVEFCSCTALADNAIIPRYKNNDMTKTTCGKVICHWSPDGTNGEVFIEVTNETNLSGYQWNVAIWGLPA